MLASSEPSSNVPHGYKDVVDKSRFIIFFFSSCFVLENVQGFSIVVTAEHSYEAKRTASVIGMVL